MFRSIGLKLFFGLLVSIWAGALIADDVYEQNDTLATASTLALGSYPGLQSQGADEDWYKFENLKPGLLHVTMDHPQVPANPNNKTNDLKLVLYNSSGQVVGADNSGNIKEEVFYHVVATDDYYAKVYALNGGSNTYTLTAQRNFDASGDDSNEGNDTLEAATPISNYHESVTNQISKDEDWFSIFVPAGSIKVTVSYSGSTPLKLEGYNSSNNRFNDAVGSNGSVSIDLEVAAETTLYLAVLGGDGTSYTLDIDHPVKWYQPLNTGPISASSPTIHDIDGDGKGEVLIGSTAYLDSDRKEVQFKPAALIALEDDGSVKWTTSFPAVSSADPVTGHIYSTSSIASRPLVGDVDGDGSLEVVVSVGVDLDSVGSAQSPTDVYSPGHKGGVYVLDALTGAIEWSRISLDTIGGSSNQGDGLPDGVISSPIMCDVNQDGIPEIAWASWDQRIYLVDGRDGTDFAKSAGGKWPVNMHDTNWSSPLCADINNDGLHEILIGGDITENADARTLTGGLFHVYDRWGREIIEGFRAPIDFSPGSGQFSFYKGKYEEQTIWSSPIAGDLDGDGTLEIAYGTGLFFLAPKGQYVMIWNHDGSQYLKLITQGRTYGTPLFADIDNDGDMEVVATTAKGWIHAWDHTGVELFSKQTYPSGAAANSDNPIYSSPLAVDMDGDGDLEIIYQQGVSVTVLDHAGTVLTSDPTKWGLTNEYYRGTPAIGDLDGDGKLEIVTGGTTDSRDSGVVYAFKFGGSINSASYNYARRQFRESGVVPISPSQVARRQQVNGFVGRFYSKVLVRSPDAWGLSDWVNRLLEGDKSGGDVGRGFILSGEFTNKATTNDFFLETLYQAFFGRPSDSGGKAGWMEQLNNNTPRSTVLEGFIGAQEFQNLVDQFNITRDFGPTEGLSRVLVEELVTRFYNQVLLRSPDSIGLTDWVDSLMNDTKAGSDVANGFIGSQEFINRGVNDEEYVKVLYKAFFGRSADPGGLSGWVNGLDPSQDPVLSRQQVLDGFIASQEFKNLAAEYGINPTL